MTDTFDEQLARVADVLMRGGTLMMHPDTWEEFRDAVPKMPHATICALVGVPVKSNAFCVPGTLYAVEKDFKGRAMDAIRAAQQKEPKGE